MDLIFFSCIPSDNGNLKEQVIHCLSRLSSFLSENNLPYNNIVTQTVYLNANTNQKYKDKRNEVKSLLKSELQDELPTNYIAQLPANGAEVAFEYHIWGSNSSNILIEDKKYLDYSYKLITDTKIGCKYLFTAGISSEDINADVLKCTEDAFAISKRILEENQMNFGNVYRQWNYVENILKTSVNNSVRRQNYQILNDVRTIFYNKDEFKKGYPAATGVGTYAGGIILSFYAVSYVNDIVIDSIENSLQVPAFKYSENVLIGDSTFVECEKTSPKFARAKYVKSDNKEYIWVSGTASIRGEETIGIGDVAVQTKVTLENIENLISENKEVGLVCLRGYIKKEEFHNTVYNICKKAYPDVPILLVVSDVCRDDLFVEIEAIARNVN